MTGLAGADVSGSKLPLDGVDQWDVISKVFIYKHENCTEDVECHVSLPQPLSVQSVGLTSKRHLIYLSKAAKTARKFIIHNVPITADPVRRLLKHLCCEFLK